MGHDAVFGILGNFGIKCSISIMIRGPKTLGCSRYQTKQLSDFVGRFSLSIMAEVKRSRRNLIAGFLPQAG